MMKQLDTMYKPFLIFLSVDYNLKNDTMTVQNYEGKYEK